MAQIGSLSVKLGLVTVGWDQATDKAKQQAKQLQKSIEELGGGVKKLQEAWKMLGGSFGVGSIGLAALIQQTAAFADQIDDLAKGFGVSTGFALQFSHALQQAGASSEAAGKMIGKLFENIDAAKEGNQQAVDGFRKLGIGFDEIKKLTPEDAIKRVVSALSEIQDPIKRAAELRKQLGKGGLGLDIQEVDSIIQGGIGNWQKYGDNLERVSKIKDNLSASLNNLLIAFSTFIGPLTRDGIVTVEKFQGALAGVATYFVASKLVAAAQGFMAIAGAIRASATAAVAFNVATIGTPIGLLLKLAAAGAAFLVYKSESGALPKDLPAMNPMGDITGAENETALSAAMNANHAQASKNKSDTGSAPAKGGGWTPQEVAVSAALATEKIKTANAEVLAGIPIWDDYTQKIAGIGIETSNALAGLNTQRANLQNQYKDSKDLLGLELAKLREQEKQILINRDKKLLEAETAKQILDYETERVRQEGYLQGVIKLNEETQKRRLDNLKAILDAQLKEIDYATELLNIEIDQNMALSDNAKALAKQTADYEASIAKLQKQLDALPEYIQPLPDEELSAETEANNRRIEAIKKQMDFETARHSLRMDQLNKERTFEYGFERAVNQILDNGTNAARIASDMVNSVFGNMESAIDNFVKTGKFSFSDFTRSVIRDLISIQMKAQAVQMLRSAGVGGGLLGSLQSGFNSVFGFQNEAGGMEVAGSLGFANGGDPPVGQPSLVGERGPEMFVPKTAGTIIPNHSLMGMLNGNGGQTINYNGPFIQNMSAIDTQSGIQFLSRNKQAVWAANQSAQRSLPMSK